MTSNEYESKVCKDLSNRGFWALNIPKNHTGAQPFDVIALKEHIVLALDCKVCQSKRFSISRVEPNQWTSFAVINKKVPSANIGLMLYRNDNKKEYWIEYEQLLYCQNHKIASIELNEDLEVNR